MGGHSEAKLATAGAAVSHPPAPAQHGQPSAYPPPLVECSRGGRESHLHPPHQEPSTAPYEMQRPPTTLPQPRGAASYPPPRPHPAHYPPHYPPLQHEMHHLPSMWPQHHFQPQHFPPHHRSHHCHPMHHVFHPPRHLGPLPYPLGGFPH